MDQFCSTCGVPPVVSHTSNITTGTDYGDTITYTCLSGYEKAYENLVRTCQADKNWSGRSLVCCKYYLVICRSTATPSMYCTPSSYNKFSLSRHNLIIIKAKVLFPHA